MKKLIIFFIAIIFILMACSNESLNESPDEPSKDEPVIGMLDDNDFEFSEEVEKLHEEAMESQKDLYLTMLNNLLAEFDEEYENFETEVGVKLYEVIISTPGGIDVAKKMKEKIIENVPEDNQDVYDLFYDRIVSLEETFSDIEWSD
ncbi:hypothetical protein KHA93_02920 [Bacillus sp. FJAT-49732]|uniref:Uncharacterized protein n=1 Tax=Lederbergia citrisecunda TaxID=2833583 RepID=A0A942TIE4_9BACI|nr:hypothetical protein [Lederbergia citrisecunda]MBS4198600.1 hypothetical protein [Lederbergia citrisecunda]